MNIIPDGEGNSVGNLWRRFLLRYAMAYNRMGFVLRMGCDLAVVNMALLFGYLMTIVYKIVILGKDDPGWARGLLLYEWLPSVPLFSIACVLAFMGAGLYSRTVGYGPGKRLFTAFIAVSLAFLLHVFFMYCVQSILPRSSVVSGWCFALILIVLVRVGRSMFYRRFVVLPRVDDTQSFQESRNAEVMASEFGWVSPQKVAKMTGGEFPFPVRFALWPYFGQEEIQAAVSVLRSGKVNRWTGTEGAGFDREFADFCECEHGISVANGTVAIELALRALGVGPGDEVIVPCRTFIGSASPVLVCGAKPVIVDIDRSTQTLTADTIRPALNENTKVIVAVHLAGWPCDMGPIMELADEHGLHVIEDCAQAHGAKYRGRPVGSLGHVATFSFCQDKIMTTGGEGGMLVTNDRDLWRSAWSYKDHGKSHDAVYGRKHPPGFRWLHESSGTNWRMTEVQTAIGRAALKKLPTWVETRRRYAQMLTSAFETIAGLRATPPPADIYHSYYKYYAFVEPESLRKGWDRDRVMNAIVSKGIPCYSGICGQIQKEKALEGSVGLSPEGFVVAEELMETSLMFLVHPTLTETDIRATIQTTEQVLSQAAK